MSRLKYVTIFIAVFLLSACQSTALSEKTETFSAEGGTYSFRLIDGWEVEKEYEKVFHKEAVFGAEDTNSQSVMFIKVNKRSGNTLEETDKMIISELKQGYSLEENKTSRLKQEKNDVLHYVAQGVYKRKPYWIHFYYVVLQDYTVEFQFYSHQDSSDEKRVEDFEKSVQTLKVVPQEKKTQSSERVEIGKAENERIQFQITSYKGEMLEGNTSILIIRYVTTNKSKQEIIPGNEWSALVKVKQGTEFLKGFSLNQQITTEEELNYLVKMSQQPLQENESVECAAIYRLNDTSRKELTVIFDDEVFAGKEAVGLKID